MVDDNRSPLWGMAAGGALLGGVGYGIYTHRNSFARALKLGSNDVVTSTLVSAQNITGFTQAATMSTMVQGKNAMFEQAMSGFAKSRGIPDAIGDIKTAAYESIMSTGKVAHLEALGALDILTKQETATDAYKAAVDAVAAQSGDADLFTRRLDQFMADENRSHVLASAASSPGGYGTSIFGNATLDDLSPEARRAASELRENFGNIAGDRFNIGWEYKVIDDIIGGKSVSTPMALASIEGNRIAEIPLAATGYTYSGENLTARYLTRGAYRQGGEQISYAELYERTIGDVLSASRNNTQLKNKLLNAHRLLIEQMGERDASHRAAAVWTAPFMTSGGAAKSRLTLLERVAYGNIPENERMNLISRARNLYPYTSPGAAGKGTFTSVDLAQELYGPLGAFMSAEKRPTQFVRGEWGVTQAAKDRATGFSNTFGKYYNRLDRKIKGRGYNRLIYGGSSATSSTAYSAPQLMTFYAKPARTGYGTGYYSSRLNNMLATEEGIISNRVAPMMQYERIVQKRIALDKDMKVNVDLLNKLKGVKVGQGAVGLEGEISKGFIGLELGTGKEIVGEVVGADMIDQNIATVYMREHKQLSEDELFKFFSEDVKFMAAGAKEAKLQEFLTAAGAEKTIAGQRIEALWSGKLVERNPFALINQQTEAASMFLSQKIDMGTLQMSPEIQAYLADPAAALNVSGIMQNSNIDSAAQIQKNLMGMAKGWGFTSEEMGLTFGLMNRKTAIQAAREGTISAKDLLKIAHAPGVVGLSKGMIGDLALEGGAGTWGSFEQSGFRLLSMKGEVGKRYAGELASRIVGKGDLASADIMMSTLLGREKFLTKFNRNINELEEFTKIPTEELLQAKGRFVNLGQRVNAFGGSNVMYIPGQEEAANIMGDIISNGERMRSPVAQQLASLQSVMGKNNVTAEEIENAAEMFRNKALQAAEGQASARGKIAGSQILTGIRRTYEENPGVFRVSELSGERMYQDLMDRAQSEEQLKFLGAELEAFRGGKVMTGSMWRHPTTGPESLQFINFMKDETLSSGMVAAPTQFGRMKLNGREFDIDVSSMTGFKGDFDRDQFVLSVIGDNQTADMAKRAIGREQREAYSKYLFNHYAMKDAIEGTMSKSDMADVLSDKALQEGYRKLSTAKTTTGQVNIALQKLKIGMASAAPEEYRPMAELFFHLEEAAISGKHGVQEGGIYQAIARSVKEGGETGINRMTSVLDALIGKEGLSVSGSITDAFGVTRQHTLNINNRQTAEMAIGAYNAVSNDVDIAMNAAAAARGKNLGDISLREATEMYYARRTGSVDVSQAIMQAAAKNTDDFTVKASRHFRAAGAKARGLFGAIKRAKKPLLAGAGLAAGIMALAPSTAGVLRNPEGPNAGQNMSMDDYGPPSGPPMNPPNPGMNASPRAYDIGSEKRSSHANIRMRVNDLNSSSRDFMNSARQLSNGGNVNIRTRDDRSLLDPRMLASKIHERL